VLSEFAGAAAELRGAVLANPYDPQEMVNACYLALIMNKDEARSRIREAFDTVSHHDIQQWGEDFFAAVRDCRSTLLEFDADSEVDADAEKNQVA